MNTRRSLWLTIDMQDDGEELVRFCVVEDGDLSRAVRFRTFAAAHQVMHRQRDLSDLVWACAEDLTASEFRAELLTTEGPAAAARAGDPSTSHQAALSIKPGTVRQAVLKTARRMVRDRAPGGGITLAELTERYRALSAEGAHKHASEASIRSRAAELMRMGYMWDTGNRRVLPTGRKARVLGVML